MIVRRHSRQRFERTRFKVQVGVQPQCVGQVCLHAFMHEGPSAQCVAQFQHIHQIGFVQQQQISCSDLRPGQPRVFAFQLQMVSLYQPNGCGPPTESPSKYRVFCCLLLCFPHHLEELIMTGTDVLPSLLYKISQNQIAICAAIEELSLWVEQRGSTQVSDKVRHSLELLHQNAEFISEGIADLKVSH